MRKVYTALNLPDAHLVMHRLRHAGIEARVLNEHAASAVGEIPVGAGLPEVWVTDSAYAPRARQIIEAFCLQRVNTHEQLCRECGERNPGEFELCWNCGLAFPAAD